MAITTEGRTFDRIPHFDPKNRSFPIAPLVAARKPRSYSWAEMQLDQGREGACVGFGWTMDAAARPVPVFGDPIRTHPDFVATQAIAFEVYHRAQQLDDWPGESYEGSSVLAGAKAGVERGWYGEYRWALGTPEDRASDVMLAIGYNGPVVMGTNWYYDMMPSRSGDREYITPTGGVAGGHCYILTKVSIKRDAVWTPNSWGGDGQGWIRRTDLAILLANDGEACIPVTRRKA